MSQSVEQQPGDHRHAEGDESVERHDCAQDLQARGQEAVAVVLPAEEHEHHALDHEQEAEREEDGVRLEGAAVLGAPYQRREE
ncbi:MAG: hypothetical protein R6W77_09265 [Trueperaceae bacterium]